MGPPPKAPTLPHRLPTLPPECENSSDEEPAARGELVLRASPRGHQAFGALTAFRRAPDGPPHLGSAKPTRSSRPEVVGGTWALCALLDAFLTLHVVLVLPLSLAQTTTATEKGLQRVDPEVLVAQWAKKKLLQLRSPSLESETRVTFISDIMA